MSIDWKEVEENNGRKRYAEPGIHKVKCVGVDIHEVGQNGSIAQDFIFEEDKYKYPKATHWLTFKEGKDGWRQWHNRQLMIVLGSDEETTEKGIEKIENMGSKEKIVKGYQTAYDMIVKKNPEVEIEVYPDGQYTRAEFTDERVAMPHSSTAPAPVATAEEDAPEDIEEGEEIDLSSIPF